MTPASFLRAVTSPERLSGHCVSHRPPSLMYSLHLCHCTHAVARRPGQSMPGHLGATSITAAATDSYLVQLHLIRCPPPSSWAAGALIRWHNHDVVPPGKEGKHKRWTLSHVSGRSPNNTCHMPSKDDLLLSLTSTQEKSSVRKRSVFLLYQRREYSPLALIRLMKIYTLCSRGWCRSCEDIYIIGL